MNLEVEKCFKKGRKILSRCKGNLRRDGKYKSHSTLRVSVKNTARRGGRPRDPSSASLISISLEMKKKRQKKVFKKLYQNGICKMSFMLLLFLQLSSPFPNKTSLGSQREGNKSNEMNQSNNNNNNKKQPSSFFHPIGRKKEESGTRGTNGNDGILADGICWM